MVHGTRNRNYTGNVNDSWNVICAESIMDIDVDRIFLIRGDRDIIAEMVDENSLSIQIRYPLYVDRNPEFVSIKKDAFPEYIHQNIIDNIKECYHIAYSYFPNMENMLPNFNKDYSTYIKSFSHSTLTYMAEHADILEDDTVIDEEFIEKVRTVLNLNIQTIRNILEERNVIDVDHMLTCIQFICDCSYNNLKEHFIKTYFDTMMRTKKFQHYLDKNFSPEIYKDLHTGKLNVDIQRHSIKSMIKLDKNYMLVDEYLYCLENE